MKGKFHLLGSCEPCFKFDSVLEKRNDDGRNMAQDYLEARRNTLRDWFWLEFTASRKKI